MQQVLIITQYSLPEHKRNMNAYQRVYYGANHAHIHLLIRRKQCVSQEIDERVEVHKSPFENRWLFFLYSIFFAIILCLKGCRIILTEPSGFAIVGFVAKYLAGYFWVMDVWDRPLWRKSLKKRFSDHFVFFIMGFADLYLLSVLPRAAMDIQLNPTKCLQLYNAIDLTGMAKQPPLRTADDPTLHLAYGRANFLEGMGLELLVEAAEKLKSVNCPVVIHLVGELSKEYDRLINASEAVSLFCVHGFISENRGDFFQKIHVGLVPYLPFEDLSYIFPIKVLEHLSQGNPVIASRLPGLCATITHEFNGLIVEPGDADQLAEVIRRLQEDRQLWEQLAWNALRSVEKFNAPEKNWKIFTEIFARESANR